MGKGPIPIILTFRCYLLVLLLLLLEASASTYPAIFIFGDSIVDPGNNNFRVTPGKANFPPYGQDFAGHKPTGRFSNGKVPGDFIGIKELLPAYLAVDLQPDDLLTGVAFASGGSGYDPLTSKIPNAISLAGQLELFGEYKEKLKALAGEEAAARIVTGALFVTCLGSNDIVNNYFILPARRYHYDLPSYVRLLVTSAKSFIKQLHVMGARNIAVVGLPPLGCVPSQRTVGGVPSRECDASRNQASELFNSKITEQIDSLNTELGANGTRLLYMDIYNVLTDLIQRPSNYGFKDSNNGCCGNGIQDAAIFLAYHKCCRNVSEYVFWDSFHPSERAYEIVIDKLLSSMPRN